MGYNNQLHKKSTSKSRIYIMNKKWLVVGVVVVILVVCGSVGSWLYISNQKSSSEKTAVQEEIKAKQVFDTKQSLDTKANNGDVEGSLAGYDKAISETTDEVSKRNLLIDQSVVALNNNKLDKALVAILSADKIKSDNNTLGLIATIYDKMGNVQKAIEYYQKAVNDGSKYNFEKSTYQSRIDQLQGEK